MLHETFPSRRHGRGPGVAHPAAGRGAERRVRVRSGHPAGRRARHPSWLTEDAFSPAELRALLRKHIFDEVGHFKGRIWAWDVVNEAVNDDGTLPDTYGMQGHLAVQYGLPGGVLANARRFDALGLQTAFTEVDVRMPLPPDGTKVAAQSQGFTMLLTACLLTRHCVSYTLWGFTDKYSWVPGVFAGDGSATPMDENFVPKPDYHALHDTLLLAGR